jgi:hypothetical protein
MYYDKEGCCLNFNSLQLYKLFLTKLHFLKNNLKIV